MENFSRSSGSITERMPLAIESRLRGVRSTLLTVWVCSVFLFIAGQAAPSVAGISFTDASGHMITLDGKPARVVSLDPAVTTTICHLGAADVLVGVIYEGTYPPLKNTIDIVGSFEHPLLAAIEKLQPDLIFYHRRQEAVRSHFTRQGVTVICLANDSIPQSIVNIRLLGRMFTLETAAERLVADMQTDFDLIAAKIDRIPATQRKRVARFMGSDRIMLPGDDCVQNELIRRAGGLVPRLGQNGSRWPITLAQWQHFNPEVLYGCAQDRDVAGRFFNRPGWRDVAALREDRIHYFPCELANATGPGSAYFTTWLSACIYADEFAQPHNQLRPDHIVNRRELEIPLAVVERAGIVYSRMRDFNNKTLVVDFKTPQAIISTLEGYREGILSVGNHYIPPPSWTLAPDETLTAIQARICQTLQRPADRSSFMVTGADMDHLSIQQRSFEDMQVTVLVTAGVSSNAVRMSRDPGNYYEPGTINIILLTNMQLSSRAMTRAIVSATEAKTAALWDLDIRSSYSGLRHAATGTGTDNITVVRGEGPLLDNAGGHTKLGELIARAVHAGVTEAVYRQNGLIGRRHIFQRLSERGIKLKRVAESRSCDSGLGADRITALLEELLLESRYAGFMQAALALSDRYEQGLIADLHLFESWCRQVATEIAGHDIPVMVPALVRNDLPTVLYSALNALVNGVCQR